MGRVEEHTGWGKNTLGGADNVGMFFAGLGTAVPPRRYSQKECWDAVQRAPQFSRLKSSSKATLQHVLRNDANGIRTRHLALERLGEGFDVDPDTLAARFPRHAPGPPAVAAPPALPRAALQPRHAAAVPLITCT